MYQKTTLVICTLLILGAGIVPAQAGLQDGLVAYFKLDETSGTTAADASGNGNNGTLIGTRLSWVAGRDGGALLIAAPETEDVGDRLEFPTKGMSPATGTVAMWAYLTDPQPGTSGRYLFGHSSAATGRSFADRFQIYLQDPTPPLPQRYSRKLDIGLGGSHSTKLDIVELPLDEWVHVALTWNNGAYVVYVNGEPVDNGSYTGLTTFRSVANFGNDGCGDPYEAFCGMLDEARVYNRAVTGDEIAQMCPPSRVAKSPDPVDGAVGVTTPLFKWAAGYKATLHQAYVGTSPDLGPADIAGVRSPLAMMWYIPGFKPGVTYYWRVDEIEADQTTVNTGKVWSFTTQALTAYVPSPKNGAADASLAATLAWQPGQAVVKHHVYFGDKLDAVTQGAAGVDKGTVTETTFAPGPLDGLTTYYWRVDEIKADASVVAGSVWSFTTVRPVEDFESYNDDLTAKTTIFDAWIDGLTDGLSGSMVGNANAPFAEQTVVYGGKQSMPLDYNNVKTPFYSEAERTFAPVQDWTAGGVDTLILYVRSRPGSKAPVYVQLKDSSNKTGIVMAPAGLVSTTKWAQWKVPLSEFATAGVNLARVKTLVIGVGDRANPAAGGTGRIYVDEIGLAKPAPAAP